MDSIRSLSNINQSSFDGVEMTDKRSKLFTPSEAIVSNEARKLVIYIVSFSITSVICYFGIVGNVVIIAVFYRQGYKETINISFTAIAVWDFIKCVCGAAYRFGGPLHAFSPALAQTYRSITTLLFNFPAIYCTYVSSVLAGYVAIERCLCVSLPFTVKYLLTPTVVTTVMVLLSAVTFGSFIVSFYIHKIVWRFHPGYNATVALISADGDAHFHAFQFYNIMGFVWPALSFGVQCICTWVISYHLRKAAKFRSSTVDMTNDSNVDKRMRSRDRQVTKMLLVVIMVYIVNMLPRLAMSIGKTLQPEFYVFRKYHNLFESLIWVEHLFDYINASVNPFIYFFMSSQFKESVTEMFARKKRG